MEEILAPAISSFKGFAIFSLDFRRTPQLYWKFNEINRKRKTEFIEEILDVFSYYETDSCGCCTSERHLIDKYKIEDLVDVIEKMITTLLDRKEN